MLDWLYMLEVGFLIEWTLMWLVGGVNEVARLIFMYATGGILKCG